MEAKSIMEFLANAYLYGWAGAFIFFILFIVVLRQNTSKSNELREAKDELSKKDEQITDLESEVSNLKEELDEKATKLEELEEKLSTTENSLSECQAKRQELEEQVNKLREENANLTSNIRELESKLSEAESKIKDLETTISDKDQAIERLNARVEELKEIEEKYHFAILYIYMKKLHDEFQEEFTQNILKGISNMKISEIDMETAQRLFEKAMETYYKHERGEITSEQTNA